MNIPFPGEDTPKLIRQDIATGVSGDGVGFLFFKYKNPEDLMAVSKTIDLGTLPFSGSEVTIPCDVLSDMGGGNLEAGLAKAVEQLGTVTLGNTIAGDIHPIYEDVIIPHYGSEENYYEALARTRK